MNIYLQYTWEYIINIAESGLFYYFVRTALVPKKLPHQVFFHLCGLIMRFIIVTGCDMLAPAPIYGIIICSIYHIAFTWILFQDAKIARVFWGILHGLLCLIAELIAMVLLQISLNILPSSIHLVASTSRIPATTLYIIIVAALSFFVPMLAKKKALFKKSQKIFVTLIIFLGIIITHCFFYVMPLLEASHPEIVDILIVANIVFLCIFLSLLVFVYQLAITQQEKEELQERARLLELEESQYNHLLSTTESLREIKHDIHHHLVTIQSLIERGETHRLANYLDEYQTHFDLDYYAISTGNIIVDSILSMKNYFARHQNTTLEHSIMLPEQMPFSDVALSALLGNLFDNALEASKQLPETERWIHFQIKPHENMLLIHMENSFDGVVKQSVTHRFLSRKSEPDHGVGLKRVQTLVEEAGGYTDIRHEGHTFIVHIIVPLENTNEH